VREADQLDGGRGEVFVGGERSQPALKSAEGVYGETHPQWLRTQELVPQWGDWKIAVGECVFSYFNRGMLTMCATKWNGVEAVCWISLLSDYDVALYFGEEPLRVAGACNAIRISGQIACLPDPGFLRGIDVHLPYAGRILSNDAFSRFGRTSGN